MPRPLHISFSACGFLGVYHLGAARALRARGTRLLQDAQEFAGASAGALAAAVLLTAPRRLQDSVDFALALARETRTQPLGALTPGYDLLARLRRGLEAILPQDAHRCADGRLHVSLTHASTWEHRAVSTFACREDLIQVLLASCFVPIYMGMRPVMYEGQPWLDGGLSRLLPILPSGYTLTISPFCGRTDICPWDHGRRSLHVSLAGQEVALLLPNLLRLCRALFPPGPAALTALYHAGFRDATHFLHTWRADGCT